MLETHQVMKIKTQNGAQAELEINYSSNKKVIKSQMIKFKINGQEAEIKRNDFIAYMLAIGRMEDQKKLLPMTVTRIRKLERMLTFEIKLKKNHEAGETIIVQAPWIDEIPETEEVFAGNIAKKRSPILDKFGKKESWKGGNIKVI